MNPETPVGPDSNPCVLKGCRHLYPGSENTVFQAFTRLPVAARTIGITAAPACAGRLVCAGCGSMRGKYADPAFDAPTLAGRAGHGCLLIGRSNQFFEDRVATRAMEFKHRHPVSPSSTSDEITLADWLGAVYHWCSTLPICPVHGRATAVAGEKPWRLSFRRGCQVGLGRLNEVSPLSLARNGRRVGGRNRPPSSSGLGYQVLILETGVRVPVGVPLEAFKS